MRKIIRALTVSALAVGLMAAGCTKTGQSAGNHNDTKKTPIVVDYTGKVKGPAKPVPGAKTGGNVTVLENGDFEFLDPAAIYVAGALETSTALFHRMLTNYIEDPGGGTLQLVGDLATNVGETSDGGKSWTYHLRDGIKFDDGSAITSQDVAYGLSRTFSDIGANGPQYFQLALVPDGSYKGPFTDGKLAPGLDASDPKTLKITFPDKHPELPYLMAFPTSTPVPAAKDTKADYNKQWVSSGPYRRKEYVADTKLVLEKNPNWDPNSDPIRHQYVDGFTFDFTSDADNQTQRLKSPTGDDATAVMTVNVPPNQVAAVKGDAELMKRVFTGPTPFASYIYINTARVTEVKVRQALNYAFDRDAYIKAVGGYDVANPASTILAPIVPGYKKFDAYAAANNGVNGDVAKAKQLLSGITLPKLRWCTSNTPTNQTISAVVVQGLARAGFDVVMDFIPPSDYYKTVGLKGTDCDLISGAWGEDFPDGDATLGVLMDGTKITDTGNNNLSYFNSSDVNQKLQDLRNNPDRAAAAAGYGDLDRYVMEKYAPVIPLRYSRNFSIAGPGVGGTFTSPLYAEFNLNNIYVK